MYEYLKDLLPVAELVGEPKDMRLHSGDPIFGDEITISGTTMDGREFTIRLSIKSKEAQKDAD